MCSGLLFYAADCIDASAKLADSHPKIAAIRDPVCSFQVSNSANSLTMRLDLALFENILAFMGRYVIDCSFRYLQPRWGQISGYAWKNPYDGAGWRERIT